MTHPGGHDDLLVPAIAAAKEAGDAILNVYDTAFTVEQKDDQSPLTAADKRSHEVITGALGSIPGRSIPVLSEEGKDVPYERRKGWRIFWLVDPLDGTKEFIRRNGEFTVNIALIEHERPVLGVIYVPVSGICYFAATGLGAHKLKINRTGGELQDLPWLLKKSQRLPESCDRPFSVVASRSHLSKETEDYLQRAREEHGVMQILSAGSSLKFCLVAEGGADVYPRFGPTMEWDTAAGQIIVEEAGGNVLRMDTGEPLQYNKQDMLNPWFLAKGSGDR